MSGPDEIRFTLGFEPVSKKNRMRIHYRGGMPKIGRDDRIAQDELAIAMQLQSLIAKGGWPRPLFGRDEVRVECVHRVLARKVDVLVRRLWATPKGITGRRRDVTNISPLILDAMQGYAYEDDDQVGEHEIRRVIA